MAVEGQQFAARTNKLPHHQRGGSVSNHSHQGLGNQILAYFTPLRGLELDLVDRRDITQDLQRHARIVEMFQQQGEWGVDLETLETDHEQERCQEIADR
jgi:hypothetical protein